MKRVAIVAEGDTEVEFVKQVLGPHLEAHGVITAVMKSSGLGGNISVDRLAPVMAKLSWDIPAEGPEPNPARSSMCGPGRPTQARQQQRVDLEP